MSIRMRAAAAAFAGMLVVPILGVAPAAAHSGTALHVSSQQARSQPVVASDDPEPHDPESDDRAPAIELTATATTESAFGDPERAPTLYGSGFAPGDYTIVLTRLDDTTAFPSDDESSVREDDTGGGPHTGESGSEEPAAEESTTGEEATDAEDDGQQTQGSPQTFSLPVAVDDSGTFDAPVTGASADADRVHPGTYTLTVTDSDGDAVTGELLLDVAEDPVPSRTPDDRPEDDGERATGTADDGDDASEGVRDAGPGWGTETPSPHTYYDWTWSGGEIVLGVNLSTDAITVDEFVTDGVSVVVRGCGPDEVVDLTVDSADPGIADYTVSLRSDADGNAVHGVRGLNPEHPDDYAGTYTVSAECETITWEAQFRVVDPADAEATGEDGASGQDGAEDRRDESGLPRSGTETTAIIIGAAMLVIGVAVVLLTRRRPPGGPRSGGGARAPSTPRTRSGSRRDEGPR